eukprot:tig00021432_g21219.t1
MGAKESKGVKGGLHAVLQQIENIVFVVNENADIIFANAAALKCVSFELADLTSKNLWNDMLSDVCLPRAPDNFMMAAPMSKFLGEKWRAQLCGAFSKRLSIEMTISKIALPGEAAPSYLVTCSDISELLMTKNALARAEMRRLAVIDTTMDGLVLMDSNHKIRSFNPAAASLFGWSKEEVLNKDISILVPSPHKEAHKQYVENFLTTGVKKIIGIGREVEAERKDGTTFTIQLSVSEAVQIGNDRFFLGVIRDRSRRKQAERAMSQSKTWMQNILDCAFDAFFTVDGNGNLKMHAHGWEAEPSRQQLEGARPSLQLPSRRASIQR